MLNETHYKTCDIRRRRIERASTHVRSIMLKGYKETILRNATKAVSVLLLGLFFFASCRPDSERHTYTSWSDEGASTRVAGREDAIGGCINAIHARLVSLQQDWPQLSGIKEATVTPMRLRYAKGSVRYDGKREQWSSPDACRIYVNVEKYSSGDAHQQGAARAFPESGIQVHWLVKPIRKDSMGFLRAVDSIIRDEIDKLGKALEQTDRE